MPAVFVRANRAGQVASGRVPGVSLSAGQKALARKASQSVLDELSALEQSIQAGNTLAETAVAALQADFAAFSTCWSGLSAGSTPAACTLATTAITATTATQANAAVSVSTNGKE